MTAARLDHRMAWQKIHQVSSDRDRSHAWPTTSMRNAESLVQIQMTYVRTVVARPAEPNLSVHVCPVQIYLAAIFVDNFADPANVLIENAVRRWICHH